MKRWEDEVNPKKREIQGIRPIPTKVKKKKIPLEKKGAIASTYSGGGQPRKSPCKKKGKKKNKPLRSGQRPRERYCRTKAGDEGENAEKGTQQTTTY